MLTRNISNITPQRKIMSVSKKFRNNGIKDQQGTTRMVYDSLPLDGRKIFRFFEEVSSRQFPATNITSEGNRLGVGGAMVVERGYLSVVEVGSDGEIVNVLSLNGQGTLAAITAADFSFEIANSQVMKQVSILSFDPRFNKSATFDDFNLFEFDTQITLQPLLEFLAQLKCSTYAAVANHELRLTLEGTGAIIAPRNTF